MEQCPWFCWKLLVFLLGRNHGHGSIHGAILATVPFVVLGCLVQPVQVGLSVKLQPIEEVLLDTMTALEPPLLASHG